MCAASDVPLTGDVTVLSDSSHLRFGSVGPELHRKCKFGAQSLKFVLCGPYPDTQSQAEPLWSVNSQGRTVVPSCLSETACGGTSSKWLPNSTIKIQGASVSVKRVCVYLDYGMSDCCQGYRHLMSRCY